MNTVTTAQMAIYAVMIIPVLFLLVKHGKPGFLGWIYFTAFCMLRILGGALALSGSKSAGIIANVGLSPLLLAASGILHESYVLCNSMREVPWWDLANFRANRNDLRRAGNAKLEWITVLIYHVMVAGATAILAVGASALQSSSPMPSDLSKVKAGIAILTLAWVVLVGWSIQSWFRRSDNPNMVASRAGKQVSHNSPL